MRTSTRTTVWLLAGCVGLMMTGFGVIMPVFARRLGELGGGVAHLGLMAMAFALSHALLSPVFGSLSDRIGRRPLVLLGLAGFAISNGLYLLAPSTAWFVAARAVAGMLTAGLYPAAMGAVDDVSPADSRASNVGLVMAGYGIGFVVGPVLGGALYDLQGFAAPFVVSGVLGVLAFGAALRWVPETRDASARTASEPKSARPSLLAALTGAGPFLTILLATELVLILAFSAVEPQMVFYFYDVLDWSTMQFGVVAATYGVALACAQMLLSRSSDRCGRKPVIVLGLALTAALYLGLAAITSFAPMMLAAALAGLGTGLVGPALSAQLLELAPPSGRGRMMGLKSSASSAGGVLGPLLITVVGGAIAAVHLFFLATALVLGLALVHAAVRYPTRRTSASNPTGDES